MLQNERTDKIRTGCFAGVLSLEESADIPLQDRERCHCGAGGEMCDRGRGGEGCDCGGWPFRL